jgi:Putative zinc-finger
MNCQDVQRQFSDYLDFSLSAARLALIEEHLAGCPPCREDMELLGESIREVKALPMLETPLGFVQRVMSHVREQQVQPSFWRRFVLPLSGKLPAQATAVVVVGFLSIYLLQREQTEQPAVPRPEASTSAHNSQDERPSVTAEESNGQKASAVQRRQSLPAQTRQQTASRSQQPQFSSRAEIGAAPQSTKPENARNPSWAQPAESDATVRATPVVSGTPVLTAPMAPSSSVNPFSSLADPEIPAFRANPAAIEPFADLELILRRHTAAPAVDGAGVGRKPDSVQTAAPRPIERLMAAIPDRTRPQTIWINVPENQYEHFKNELYVLGVIESEIRVPMLREPEYTDGQLRVKLTALPAAESTSTNKPAVDR